MIPPLGKDAQPVAACEHEQRGGQYFPIQHARRRDRFEAAGQAHQRPFPPAVGDMLRGEENDPRLRRQRHEEQKPIDPVAVRSSRHDQGSPAGTCSRPLTSMRKPNRRVPMNRTPLVVKWAWNA